MYGTWGGFKNSNKNQFQSKQETKTSKEDITLYVSDISKFEFGASALENISFELDDNSNIYSPYVFFSDKIENVTIKENPIRNIQTKTKQPISQPLIPKQNNIAKLGNTKKQDNNQNEKSSLNFVFGEKWYFNSNHNSIEALEYEVV